MEYNTHSIWSNGSDRHSGFNTYSRSSDSSQSIESVELMNSSNTSFDDNGIIVNDCNCQDNSCEICGDVEEKKDEGVRQEPKVIWPVPDSSQIRSGLYVCEIHSQVGHRFCHTCSTPLCDICESIFHEGHSFEDLKAVISNDIAESNKLECEINRGERNVRETIHLIQMSHGTLEERKCIAIKDAKMMYARMRAALDAREKETLKGIEDVKDENILAMAKQQDTLKGYLTRLDKVATRLKLARTRTIRTNNPVHLKHSLAESAGMCFQVRLGRSIILKNEKDWISFTAQEDELLNVLRSLGTLIMKKPGTLDIEKLSKKSANSTINESTGPLIIPKLALNPQGGPIPASPNPVIVKSQWNNSFLQTPLISVIGKNLAHPYHPDNLSKPWGVACDKDSNVYVADRSNDRIMVFRENGAFIRRIGSSGSGAGQFNKPAGIAIDCYKRIIIADKDNHRIQVLAISGRFILEFGSRGPGFGEFNYPWDVATNSAGEIVVSDTRNHRIQLFTAEGKFLRFFGIKGPSPDSRLLNSPRGVAFTPNGDILVSDFDLHRILKIDYRFYNASIVKSDNVHRPQKLIVDDIGNIIVSDFKGYKVKILSQFGNYMDEFEYEGSGPEEMERSAGIALLPNGRVVFVDCGNDRVLIC